MNSTRGDVLLDVKALKLTLGGSLILDGVSFEVIDWVREGTTTGQIVSLLGPSGVGKTRVLRILAGLDAPSSGAVIGLSRSSARTSGVATRTIDTMRVL